MTHFTNFGSWEAPGIATIFFPTYTAILQITKHLHIGFFLNIWDLQLLTSTLLSTGHQLTTTRIQGSDVSKVSGERLLQDQSKCRMYSKCSQIVARIQPECSQNVARLKSECSQNVVGMQPEYSQNVARMQPECSQNVADVAKIQPICSMNVAKVQPNCSQHVARMQPKCSQYVA